MRADPELYDFAQFRDREPIAWPDGKRIAVWVSPNLEYYEIDPPAKQFRQFFTQIDEIDIGMLNLTEEQENAAEEIHDSYHPRLRHISREIERLHTQLISLEADELTELETILTPEQKAERQQDQPEGRLHEDDHKDEHQRQKREARQQHSPKRQQSSHMQFDARPAARFKKRKAPG